MIKLIDSIRFSGAGHVRTRDRLQCCQCHRHLCLLSSMLVWQVADLAEPAREWGRPAQTLPPVTEVAPPSSPYLESRISISTEIPNRPKLLSLALLGLLSFTNNRDPRRGQRFQIRKQPLVGTATRHASIQISNLQANSCRFGVGARGKWPPRIHQPRCWFTFDLL
jgi:hypothetical protein